ncbi:MAG: EAL domain-containing protein [Gammaproteobacteria bacterium]|nr:EAL domain-containing protein [Gammaproteobacteria bacterium]MCW8911360.1 EAL domain-containing protein [Gammaproteobacteria bacterium]MCW9005141.1 EAL domain-containing protein [Gammaproteobacteria bacterium]MCW9056459.1 EAL domain-containing protein [Gammaproteobacteria bacterium]
MDKLKNIINKSSIRHQLFIMVSAGIIVMLSASTLTSTWFTNQQVKNILLAEGLEHTENLARNSTLALLYSSPENANSAIQSTLAFNGIDGLAIYDREHNRFIFKGTKDLPLKLDTNITASTEARIFYEDDNYWHFIAPVILRTSNDEMDKQLFKEEKKQDTLGYAYIILNKKTLDNIKTGILVNNLGIALIIYAVLLVILNFIIRSLTQPLKYISDVMRQTAQGQFTTQVNTSGPLEIQHIADTYNRMVKAISERDNELRAHNIRLEEKAIHDHLTGLINRIGFEESLTIAIDECKKLDTHHVLCYMDLDKFKIINDTCGHGAGDELLMEISLLFQDHIRHESDILARIGGDEFALILRNCSIEKARNITQTICHSVRDYQFNWDRKQYSIGVSIGVIPLNKDTGTLKDAISSVDSACYLAKEKGRGQIHILQPDDKDFDNQTSQTQNSRLILDAIENDKFELFHQAIAPLKTVGTKKINYEILLRLPKHQGEYMDSDTLIESAERYNLSTRIDQWVIEKSFNLLNQEDCLLKSADLCTINISPSSINNNLINFIKSNLKKHNIKPEKICFEISESSTIGNLKTVKSFIDEIHILGCLFSLDNFGSGPLSFGYLKQLNADILKIEGILIKESATDSVSLAMVKAINEIGHILNMKTIANSVETDSTLEYINNLGFDYAQGHAIHKPTPIVNN